MYKVAVLGDRDSIYGFAALGLEIYPVEDAVDGAHTLRRLAEGEYAMVSCRCVPDGKRGR